MSTQLTLPPEASAPSAARRWVRSQLADLGRLEFLDAAELGVSELVTNAFLHVRGQICVRLVDVSDRLRIEVFDDSPRPPHGYQAQAQTRATNPPTIGRGLQIVDSISAAWGVSYEDAGKCVWFQPLPEGRRAHGSHGPALDAERSTIPPTDDATPTVRVKIVDVPVNPFMHYRTRFHDLTRELMLIAVADDPGDTLPRRLTHIAQQLERFRGSGDESTKRIDAAAAAGLDRVTVEVDVPVEARQGIQALRDLLSEANAFCQQRQLLTLAAGPQEHAMRDWYLREIVAQMSGAEPTPWTGDFVVTDPEPVSH